MPVHPFQQLDYNYQRPLKSSFKPIPDSEILPNENRGREIYYGVSPDSTELPKLEEFMKQIKTANIQLPDCWGPGDSLRYLSCNNNVVGKAMTQLGEHLKWLKSIEGQELTEAQAELIANGNVRIGGRAKDHQPIFIIDLGQQKVSVNAAMDMIRAIEFVLMTMKKYMMIGYYNEKYHLIIDFRQKGVFGVNLSIIKGISNRFSNNFNGHGAITWFYNPSWGFNGLWATIKLFIPEKSRKMVVWIKKGQESMFLEHIDAAAWPKSLGGDAPDIQPGEFWPPKQIGEKSDILTKEDIIKQKLTAFWFSDDAQDRKIWTYEDNKDMFEINQKFYNYRHGLNKRIFEPGLGFNKEEPIEEPKEAEPNSDNTLNRSQIKKDNTVLVKSTPKPVPISKPASGPKPVPISKKSWWDSICCCSKSYDKKLQQEVQQHYVNTTKKLNKSNNQSINKSLNKSINKENTEDNLSKFDQNGKVSYGNVKLQIEEKKPEEEEIMLFDNIGNLYTIEKDESTINNPSHAVDYAQEYKVKANRTDSPRKSLGPQPEQVLGKVTLGSGKQQTQEQKQQTHTRSPRANGNVDNQEKSNWKFWE